MNQRHNRFLSFLLVFALITVGASPACQFISGKTGLLEICSGDGIKTISLPSSQNTTHDGKDKGANHDKCPFCTAAAHAKVIAAPAPDRPVNLEITAYENYPVPFFLPVYKTITNFFARGPPLSFAA